MLPLLYLIILGVAYYFNDVAFVWFLPVLVSSFFFVLLADAHFRGKKLILQYTQKFYKKELSQREEEYLAKGDAYWMFVTLLNTLLQLFFGLGDNQALWLFYSSVGWYILFFLALVLQVIYGKIKHV